MKSAIIREKFFRFFTERGHTEVASSSLIPASDPTILFANAGMNQFKDIFLGRETRTYKRAVSIQKCVRAGGKHNDLDNVGFTKRHLTFFEMMGNFSFGDYFKKEAIQYAWDFLTVDLGISKNNLHATVYETDDESYALWHTMVGLPQERIHRLGKKENFWSMGDVGPCGPCTEIHLDHGVGTGCGESNCGPACDCDRFLEIWNLVFMQYEQQVDGSLHELTQKGVDTGMGLERLTVVMQKVNSVFETDLFIPLMEAIEKVVGIPYHTASSTQKAAYNVLADHARSATFLIADGCLPSNEGRGYVLRKIIRRAALFAQKITDNHDLFPLLSQSVITSMHTFYPSLVKEQETVYSVLHSEVKKFMHNLVRGNALVKEYVTTHTDTTIIDGKHAFILYDTYGFPLELITLAAQEYGYTVDTDGFGLCMEEQQKKSGKKNHDPLDSCEIPTKVTTTFTGYHELTTQTTINGFIVDGLYDEKVPRGTPCFVLLKESPFFIVGGGQVPDTGTISIDGHLVPVEIARYINGRIALQITAPVDLAVGTPVVASVHAAWRTKAMKNHTATHLLQAALTAVLGNTIKQAGSLVHPDYLRFDFTYHDALTADQIKQVEDIVNEKIMLGIPVTITYTTMQEAVQQGALAFFGDKYNPEKVRVVAVEDFSVELCGGTHVANTGVIGCFKITEVSALSAGTRRIVAVTGPGALELFQETYTTIKQIAQALKVPREQVLEQIHTLVAEKKHLQLSLDKEKKAGWAKQVPDWVRSTRSVRGVPFTTVVLEDAPSQNIREVMALLQQQLPGCYCVMSNTADQEIVFMVQVAPAYQNIITLKPLVDHLKNTHNIRCGGTNGVVQGTAAYSFKETLGEKIYRFIAEESE